MAIRFPPWTSNCISAAVGTTSNTNRTGLDSDGCTFSFIQNGAGSVPDRDMAPSVEMSYLRPSPSYSLKSQLLMSWLSLEMFSMVVVRIRKTPWAFSGANLPNSSAVSTCVTMNRKVLPSAGSLIPGSFAGAEAFDCDEFDEAGAEVESVLL